jgi:cell fate regulator YaaT (PSP1 superfamily)
VLVSLGCSAVFSPHSRVLMSKRQEEEKALQLCQAKVRQKKLPMEVVDAEYQWSVLVSLALFLVYSLPVRDRRKLTFYFVAEKRIDFRELVRELFRSVVAPFDYSYRVLTQV